MKKQFILIAILLAAFLAGLTGCGPSAAETEAQNEALLAETVSDVQTFFAKNRYVYQNLNLIKSSDAVRLTYASNNDALKNDGTIKRSSLDNVDVSITVTIEVGGKKEDHTFPVTVLSQKYVSLERQLLGLMPNQDSMIYEDLNFNRHLDAYDLEYQFSSHFDESGKILAQNEALEKEKIIVTLKENEENNVFYVFDFYLLPQSVRTLCFSIRELVPLLTEGADHLDLPAQVENAALTWKSLTPAIINDQGDVLEVTNRKYEGMLEATIKIGQDEYKAAFEVINTVTLDDVFQVIETELDKDLNSYVYSTLNLTIAAYYTKMYGATVSFRSLNPEFLTDEGGYIAHEYDEQVGMEVTVDIQGIKHTFVHQFTSRGVDDATKIERIGSWLESYLATTPLTDQLELPVTHERYAGKIHWISFGTTLIDNQTLSLPEEAGTYEVSAEVVFNALEKRFFFNVNLNARDAKTEDQEVVEFLLRSIPGEIYGATTLYDGNLPVVTDSIIPETAPHFGDMTDGKMETPDQSMLDQVYPGYQLPNDQNIVWVVVHETGISTPGAYANVFSNTQVNRSLNGFGGDATASWHYTVDGHQIMQNFEDNQHVYHAGDGAGSIFYGGNRNGIGIEMCMNTDGNAETAMRNNAKLIAMLLHKYNLTLENVKQHFDFSSYQKNCPQNIRKNHRWYEFLGYIANEYRAQELLAGKEITYTISENEYADLWKFEANGQAFNLNMLNVYKAPETDTEITITIHYNGQDYPIKTIIKADSI